MGRVLHRLVRQVGDRAAAGNRGHRRYRNLGLEGAARRARHEVFARADADFIVLAQHRDDQAETLLLRLLRGAGARGLAAMSPLQSLAGARARLLRPLLGVSRAEIETYARLRGLEWVEDESNADTIRRRNFLRHHVFPLLERQFPAARATIARTAAHLAEARELLDEMARTDFERCSGPTASIPGIYSGSVTLVPRTSCAIGAKRTGRAAPGGADRRAAAPVEGVSSEARIGFAVRGWKFLRYRDKLTLQPAAEP